MTLVSVLKSGNSFAQVSGNPVLDSLDGLRRAPLQTLLAPSWGAVDRAAFGLYRVDVTAPEGMQWTRGFTAVSGMPVAQFEPIPVVVPKSVTMRQARLALLGANLLSAVNTAVVAMPGTSGEAARIEWEFSGEVQRNQPLVVALGLALGLSAAQLDALFIAAGAL